jgi:Sulfotransferase domain
MFKLGSRTRPHFLIIGAQRCGTTTFYDVLTQASDVKPAAQKEVHFFDWQYGKGTKWYQNQFPRRLSPGEITGEASPYYLYHPLVPKRVKALLPDVRIIVLLRNPIDRAYSNYWFEVEGGYEKLSFADAIKAEPERLAACADPWQRDPMGRHFSHEHQSYLARGRYAEQLRRWLQSFDRASLHIVESKRFFSDPTAILGTTRKFLGLPRAAIAAPEDTPAPLAHRNAQTYEPMATETRQWLVDYFRPHNQQVYELCGEAFDWDR